ncbi:MAG: PilZ domain-containing protein [Vicinamibacteria bacterium]
MASIERRACARFRVPDSLVDWEAVGKGGVFGHGSRLGDLSRGGLRLLTPAPPAVGDRLRLVLRVADAEPLAVLGTVVRRSPATGQIHEVGVAFAPYGPGADDNDPSVLEVLSSLEGRFRDR